jgi:hypothetical protein
MCLAKEKEFLSVTSFGRVHWHMQRVVWLAVEERFAFLSCAHWIEDGHSLVELHHVGAWASMA